MLEKKGGIWKQIPNPFSPADSINFNERIENITPNGKYKWIEGDLEIKIPAEPLGAKPDTIKLHIQLFDRAKNSSNLIETEEIVLKH